MTIQIHDANNLALGTDEEIIARVLGGEHAMYEVLMRRNNQRLYRATRAILKDEADVEDVMQEAYVNAFAHLREFKHEARFSTWLTRIAVHEAFARLRRRNRFESSDTGETEVAMINRQLSDRSPEQRASDRQLGSVLEEAIDALPEAFRTVFVLRAVEEMSVAETAESLDIPEDTVKTRLYRARGLLQRALVQQLETNTPNSFAFHLSRCDRVVAAVMSRVRPA